jgi:hypothetical protein
VILGAGLTITNTRIKNFGEMDLEISLSGIVGSLQTTCVNFSGRFREHNGKNPLFDASFLAKYPTKTPHLQGLMIQDTPTEEGFFCDGV